MNYRQYEKDKCGVSWLTLTNKSIQYADLLGLSQEKFKGSPGWVANTLRIHGKVGINLHGEADDMTEKERNDIMDKWRTEFFELLRKKGIHKECLYNADQTGLYYQKLPNRIYVDKAEKADFPESNR